MCPAEDPIAPLKAAEEPVVLVVEDEVLIRLAVAQHLRDCGFKVLEASTGAEAQGLLLGGVNVDLIFSDITMPDVDGVSLAQWVADHSPTTPVVLTSGLPSALSAAEERCKNVRAFMPKPYDPDAVVVRVRALLRGKA